ncbi:MAG: hypothetical protein ACOCYC_04855 [bacterium]
MKKRVSRAYFVIPVIYVGVIVLLLFLQFAGTQGFTLRNGSLTLSGKRSNAPQDENNLREVVVEYAGIEFVFAADRSLMVDGSAARTLRPLEVQSVQEGFTVAFAEGVSLAFLVREDIQELQVRTIVAEELEDAERILVPFRTGQDAVVAAEEDTLASVENERGTFYLAAPPRGSVDVEDSRLVVRADAGEQTARYTPAVTRREQAVVEWFSDPAASISESRYQSRLSEYVDAAYEGWRSERFNPGSGTWDVRGGSPVFDERILTAVLAEAWARNQYTGAFNDMRRAADAHPDAVGLLSAPFLGNLREVRERYLQADEERTAELLDLARRRDPDLFTRSDVIRFAVDRGSRQLYEEIIAFARELDYRSLNVFQVIGALHNAVLSPLPNQESREAFETFPAAMEEEIVPQVVRVDDAFYLESSPGQVDVVASIHAGVIAERMGREQDRDILVRLGRNLVVSALDLADGAGFLPATLYLGDGSLQGTSGSIGPEEVYRLLSDNPWYPRQVSLFDELGRNSWIYTIAGIEDISISSTEYRITLSHPRNRTHYIIMQGVPSFDSMVLFGQPWRNDPSFERYIKGRHYNPDTETLMIKYNDDSVQDEIVLRY